MARKKAEQESELQFEQAMERLEQVVRRLEEGEVPLEEAISLYQEGMELSRLCGQKLDDIEAKVSALLEVDGQAVLKPFRVEGEQ